MARLTQSNFLDSLSYAIQTMRFAFEEESSEKELYDQSNYLVGAAAVWILCAGQNLFIHVIQTRMIERVQHEPGNLFSGPTFGLERWSFWQKGFETREREKK